MFQNCTSVDCFQAKTVWLSFVPLVLWKPGKRNRKLTWIRYVSFPLEGKWPYTFWFALLRANITQYNMATIVRALCLVAKRARFSCKDQALIARCLRHIQSVFNLIVDFHVLMLWLIDSYQKEWPLTSATWLYRGSSVQFHWGDVFCQSYPWPVIGFNSLQAEDQNFSLSKKLCLVVSIASLGSSQFSEDDLELLRMLKLLPLFFHVFILRIALKRPYNK